MNHRSLFAAVLVAHLTAACASTPDPQIEVRTVEVPVPVPVSCVPRTLQPAPAYRVTRETLLAAPDPAVRLTLAVAGFLEREARLGEVEPVVDGCRDAGEVR